MTQQEQDQNLKLPEHSFQRKEMRNAISFLEDINMIANVGGWEMDFEKNELYWTNGTKRLQDLPEDYEPDFYKALLYYKEGENRERLSSLVRRAIKQGIPFDEEFQLITAKGREIWVRSIARPEMKDGRCLRLYGSVQDITEYKLLWTSNQELRKLYDIVVSLSGKIIQASIEELDAAINATLKELGEYNSVDRVCIYELDQKTDELVLTHEWCNSYATSVIHQKIRVPLNSLRGIYQKFILNEYVYISDVKNIPDEYAHDKIMIEKRGGKSFFAIPMYMGEIFIGFAAFDSIRETKSWDEKIISLVKILVDICAGGIGRMRNEVSLMQAKGEAELSNMAKNEFIASIGNQLKTPLININGVSQSLLRSDIDEAAKEKIRLIESNGEMLFRMINDLLELSKIESESQESVLKPTRLRDMIEEIKQYNVSEIERKGLGFHTILPQDEKPFLLDEVRLKQVLINLISNAVKYTNRGSVTVKVAVKPDNDASDTYTLWITVRDTGIGISETYKKAIVEFFALSRSSLSKHGGGLSLGFHIVRRLTEIMQGSVTVESEFGMGSAFTIVLNNIPQAKAESPVDLQHVTARFKGQKLLMVDDVPTQFTILKECLKDSNLVLEYAVSGEEGVEKATAITPDLILMDISMDPGISGFEATRRLRANPITAKIPVIAFSTNTLDPNMEKNKMLFDDIVEKRPGDYNLLLFSLMKFFEHEVDTTEAKSDEKVIIPAPATENLAFLNEVVKAMAGRIEKLIAFIDISELENLITDLKTLQAQGNSDRLNTFVRDLDIAFNSFDFDAIGTLLKNFKTNLIK